MADESGRDFPRWLVAALALSSTLAPLNSTMISVALPSIGRDFGDDPKLLTQAIVTSYLITSVVAQAPAGKLGDRWGHRRALAIGQICFAVGSVAAMLAPSLPLLAIARVAMATAGALIVPSAGALLRLELPPEKRGRAFGMFGASMALSAAIGPLLGGELMRLASWRAIFAVNLVVLPVAALLARLDPHVHEEPPFTGNRRFDGIGAGLLGVALGAFVIGASAHGTKQLLLLACGFVLLVAFVRWERDHEEPVVDLRLFREKVFVAGGLLIGLHNLSMYAMLFALPGLIQTVLHVDSHHVGPVLGAMMIAMVVSSPISGRLSDRFGARIVAGAGSALSLLGAGIMFATPLTSTTSYVPSLVCFGLGLGLAASPSQASAMNVAPRASSGAASGVLATMRYVGGIAGMMVLGVLVRGSRDPSTAMADHRRALVVFAIALGMAFVCAMMLPKEPARTDT